jgi:hypothetical protein
MANQWQLDCDGAPIAARARTKRKGVATLRLEWVSYLFGSGPDRRDEAEIKISGAHVQSCHQLFSLKVTGSTTVASAGFPSISAGVKSNVS